MSLLRHLNANPVKNRYGSYVNPKLKIRNHTLGLKENDAFLENNDNKLTFHFLSPGGIIYTFFKKKKHILYVSVNNK